mmetsp:Transcript_13574/g.44241  ORF Transcript_13574/g.44241 Transcript_13574/m.44241 type:complete len:611 (-) Transcript_13574:133-1965(-)
MSCISLGGLYDREDEESPAPPPPPPVRRKRRKRSKAPTQQQAPQQAREKKKDFRVEDLPWHKKDALVARVEALTLELQSLRRNQSQRRQKSSPLPSPLKEEQEEKHTLEWQGQYSDWEDEDDERSVAAVEADWMKQLVTAIEEPSIYLLAATPDTFFQQEDDDGQEKKDDKKDERCAGLRSLFRVTRQHTVVMALLVLMITYLTILLPTLLLANFWQRNKSWTDVAVKVEEDKIGERQSHRVFLKFTSAVLLSFVFYTSLFILDEVKVFRFFLLGMLPIDLANYKKKRESHLLLLQKEAASWEQQQQQDDSKGGGSSKHDGGVKDDTEETEAADAPKKKNQNQNEEEDEDDSDEQRPRRRPSTSAWDRRLAQAGFLLKSVEDRIFRFDGLLRPILVVGSLSKIVSLVCVLQLTYLIFITGFKPVDLLLNSVALQFILQVDAALVTAMKTSPTMRRYFAKSVKCLRREADLIVQQDGLLRDIVEPTTVDLAHVARHSISNAYAERLTRRYPRFFAWLPADFATEENVLDTGETISADRVQQRHRCFRSEFLHRIIRRFVLFYGCFLIALQIAGNVVCSFRSVCRAIDNSSDEDHEHEEHDVGDDMATSFSS